jgi:hypothetical protein
MERINGFGMVWVAAHCLYIRSIRLLAQSTLNFSLFGTSILFTNAYMKRAGEDGRSKKLLGRESKLFRIFTFLQPWV